MEEQMFDGLYATILSLLIIFGIVYSIYYKVNASQSIGVIFFYSLIFTWLSYSLKHILKKKGVLN
jgi:hypothetical protein